MLSQPIKLLIVDDHDIMREGLVLLLEDQPDIEIVGLASDGQEAIEKNKTLKPDIILMDIAMKGISGLEATRRIVESTSEANIIMLTMHENRIFFLESLRAGASGYFLKGSDSEDLSKTIRQVFDGGIYLSPRLAGELVQFYIDNHEEASKHS